MKKSRLTKNNGAGKGGAPRSIFSKEFKVNYDGIDWGEIAQREVDKDILHAEKMAEKIVKGKCG